MSGDEHGHTSEARPSEPWPGSAYERRWIAELDRHAREGCPVCKATTEATS